MSQIHANGPCTCRLRTLVLAALCVGLGAGCGGPVVGKVRGKVLVDGQPVTQGTVMFYPEDGRAAIGQIEVDGTYALTTFHPRDGALVGEHRVAIQSTRVGPGSLAEPKSLDEELELSRKPMGGKILVPGRVDWIVPQKYSRPETSGLTASVKPGSNILDFDLPAKPK